MEAEGDSTVFDMNLKVLRADNGTMMKLIRSTESADNYNPASAFPTKAST
jgi:hypothetical protein